MHLLLRKIDDYLAEVITLRELETSLLTQLQAILDSGNPKAITLANQVDASLISLGEGIIEEAELRERLLAYLRMSQTDSVTLSEGPETEIATGSEAETVLTHWSQPPRVVDYRQYYAWV